MKCVATNSLQKLTIALCMILFAGLLPVMAQVGSRVITGSVRDSAGASLSGATVNVKGSSIATSTDAAGHFSISVPAKTKSLVISYVGMESKEVSLTSSGTVDVRLNNAATALNDVVVVGYGRQRKESVVGAIVQTSGKDLQRTGGVSSVGAALTGNVPGVITVQGTGMPGNEDPTIYIRGQGSLVYQAPLILVDGIERPMNGVDIGSIESVSVLKDASATAVFGVKGANGVILITTKRGVAGKANINATVNYTLKLPSRLPAKYDAYDALRIRDQSIERELAISPASWQDYTPLAIMDKYRHPANAQEAQQYPNIDWSAESLKKLATAQNANISVSGGSDFVKYFTSVDFLHEGDIMKIPNNGKGYTPGFFYDRLNVRSNLDFKLTSSTTLSANLAGLSGNQQGSYSGFEYSWYQGIYGNAPDLFYPQYSDGYYGYYPLDPVSTNNPALILGNNGVRNTKTTTINTDFVLNQDLGMLIKNLSLRGTYSLDNRFVSVGGITDGGSNLTKWINPLTGAVSYGNTAGANQFDYVVPLWGTAADAFNNNQTYRKKFYQLQMNYSAKVGKHNITAMGLFMRTEEATGSNFARYREDWVGRVTYNFANRYFAEFNGAYDGSDQFGPNYRFGFFPSAALGWTITNEKFMRDISWISSLKLRGSYGKVGNDNLFNVPPYLYIPQQYAYNSASGSGGAGQLHTGENGANSPYNWYRESSIGNPDVHWETAAKANIGLDYSFLRGVITGSFDVYQDDRYDLLVANNQRAVPVYFGGAAPPANLGKTRVRGYELEVKLNKNVSKNLRLWSNLAFTHSKDKILLADNPKLLDPYLKSEGFQIGQTRSQINTGFYNSWDQLYGSTMVDQNDQSKLPGNFNLLDYNGDGVINSFDNVPYGYPSRPQNTYTGSFGFDYKRFSFFVQLYAVNNVTREMTQTNFAAKLNSVYKQGDYWSPDNTTARGPVPRWKSQGYSNGNFYLYDGSYVRLKNAEISYTINPVWLKHVGIQSMRVYANGDNLLFFSKMPDDREANVGSNNYSGQGAYPTVRRVNFGFNLSL